jgi:hypothetical protein
MSVALVDLIQLGFRASHPCLAPAAQPRGVARSMIAPQSAPRGNAP